MTLHLPVILGTSRGASVSRHVARWFRDRLAEQPRVVAPLIDPRDLPLGNLDEREWEMSARPRELDDLVRAVEEADGFAIVTPEYNHGYPGALKNVLDFIYDEWNDKPFALVTTGGVSGGLRAMEQLKLVLLALKAHPLPSSLPIAHVGRAFDASGEPVDPKLGERADRTIRELVHAAEAFRAVRARKVAAAPA